MMRRWLEGWRLCRGLASSLLEDTWLTVTTRTGDLVAEQLPAAGTRPFREHKTLMSIALARHPRPQASHGYRGELTSDGPLEYLRVVDRDGVVAARGTVAVVGADAVMHDIQTDPAHRRRGLGSVVMGVLAGRAIERGARTGLLMATTDGFHLYRKLGRAAEATM